MPPDSDDQIRAALLADILANPDDDGPRLVFADWLSERGDPRGELISVQCALHRATGVELAQLVNRSSDLLYRNPGWLHDIRQIVRGVETKRGFVASINATASVFANQCGPLFEREPIQELRLIGPSPRDLATLAKTPHLARLRSLVFLDDAELAAEVDVQALRDLLASPQLANVRMLDLRLEVCGACTRGACAVFAELALPALEQLKLRVRPSDEFIRPSKIVDALATAALPALRQLATRPPSPFPATLHTAFPAVAVTTLPD